MLQLKPDFHQAHLQRARILAKEGEFEEAQDELKGWLDSEKGKKDDEAKDLVSLAWTSSVQGKFRLMLVLPRGTFLLILMSLRAPTSTPSESLNRPRD